METENPLRHPLPHQSYLLTSQTDEVFRRIQAAQFNPADFKWTPATSDTYGSHRVIGERLVHRPTDFYFDFIEDSKIESGSFGPPEGPHSIRFSPSFSYRMGGSTQLNWDNVLEGFDVWLECLRHEFEAPDLWRQLHEGRLPVLKAEVDEAAAFSSEEVGRLTASVDSLTNELRKKRRKLGLSKDEVELLAKEFDGLKSLTNASNKKQWAHLLVGIVVTFSLQVAYNPDRTRQLLELVGRAFDWLVEVAPMLPP